MIAFNSHSIVYDNTPWRPGRDIRLTEKNNPEDEERKFKNLATRIMSNGVEVLVKDKSSDGKQDQRQRKLMHTTSLIPQHHFASSTLPPKQSILSSAVVTVVSNQLMSAMFPLHQLLQHNYIIKTCMTTYTYLTTIIQNKRSAVSTFETIVSVVTTESLTNIYASDIIPDIRPTKIKYMEIKTHQPNPSTNLFQSNFPKINKRVDSQEEINAFDLIQPSEVDHLPCAGLCSCSNTKTEDLNTKHIVSNLASSQNHEKHATKFSNYRVTSTQTTRFPTMKETYYGPYEYESNTQLAPTDKIVEKYTEVINDFSDEKDTGLVDESELLTNEQAPTAQKVKKESNNKDSHNSMPEKPQKPNKNKVVADLFKLGSLSIKGLSQLAPVLEKMTGGFIKRQDVNKNVTSTAKPVTKLTSYNVNKRIDSESEPKHDNFPIYIPMNEMETSESKIRYSNVTLHQNLAWAAGNNRPKAHIVLPKLVHESPLVNGGIPISPGEIITANSDVIVGKPAVGGPLTLAASGIKLHNPAYPPPSDSFVSANEAYLVTENVLQNDDLPASIKIDDSFDLRPPSLPKSKIKPNRNLFKPMAPPTSYHNILGPNRLYSREPTTSHNFEEHLMKTEQIKSGSAILGNHGRPAFLDYIPSLAKPNNNVVPNSYQDYQPQNDKNKDMEVLDNSPSSSEIIATKVIKDGLLVNSELMSKPFLVDIQPSRVANVLIPRGSSTALVFAGSSEPHKTGDYIDDPLPYPEPGYFGSFSIDAPQMTNVHNVAPSNKKGMKTETTSHNSINNFKPSTIISHKDKVQSDKIPPPTSNQETHLSVGPHITAYNPELFNPETDFAKYDDRQKYSKGVIDKEYENFLAVPPPPPPKRLYNQDFDKHKPYNQKPIVHTKPVQDMKVFLNIQHPVTRERIKEQTLPKVTSEVYFASQSPNNSPTSTYTIHLPSVPTFYDNQFKQGNNKRLNEPNINNEQYSDSFSEPSHFKPQTKFTNKSNVVDSIKNNGHKVNLNTVQTTEIKNLDHYIGSVDPNSQVTHQILRPDQINTDIPVGTNVAIRVEDGTSSIENYYHNDNNKAVLESTGKEKTSIIEPVEASKWNKNSTTIKQSDIYNKHYEQNNRNPNSKDTKSTSMSPFSSYPTFNSHANFPMINEYTMSSLNYDIKPVKEDIDELKQNDPKRPAKVITNLPSNSHGWYSSLPLNENTIINLNNINVEATTRNMIPLIRDYNSDSALEYEQKPLNFENISTGLWSQNVPPILANIGKPFSKPIESKKPHSTKPPPLIHQSTNPNYAYLPASLGESKQPVYDIPIRDNSYETTTIRINKPSTEKLKPVYETSDEIYDGEDEAENEADSEISSESMKVPVVSIKINDNDTWDVTKSLLKEAVYNAPVHTTEEYKNVKLVDFNSGTQTEKPFGSNNKIHIIRPDLDNSFHLKPRPFTVQTSNVLDHQLQQPHWQINELMENLTNVSYEENLELNLGEEFKTITTIKPSTVLNQGTTFGNKYKKPIRPIFSVRPNSSNDPNIITSTLKIQDKKPLTVEIPEKSTLPTFITSPKEEMNRSSGEIVNLDPPPPTLDYNFKPSTNDETIMGMSPPPPRNHQTIRNPLKTSTIRPIIPVKTPQPYRPKPLKTLPPRFTTQRPNRKPDKKDDVSTYRPAFDFVNNIKRHNFNKEGSVPQVYLPPVNWSSDSVISKQDIPTINTPPTTHLVFSTPTSSGWLTSSGVDYSSAVAPTPIIFSELAKPTEIFGTHNSSLYEPSSSIENSYSYEGESLESIGDVSSETPNILYSGKLPEVNEANLKLNKSFTSNENKNRHDSVTNESQEQPNTNKLKLNETNNKKQNPIRQEEKKPSISKYKLPPKSVFVIEPTKTLSRPNTRSSGKISIKKIMKPLTKSSGVYSTTVIDSSEGFVNGEYIKPTEVLNIDSSTLTRSKMINSEVIASENVFSAHSDKIDTIINPTHHAGNEVKISDEIIPTKTEYKTTIVTLTKTLLEPPQTVSSIGYVNLTHTLTVTHTMTSLISQSEGAVTQTLVLTNTHTSTIVDVVTKIHTQVQPTTIIETVTKHIPVLQVEPTPVQEITATTKVALDDIAMSSEEQENFIIKDNETTENVQNIEIENENDNETFFVVMNKSQTGDHSPPVSTDIETGEYDGITRNEQINSNGVSQVLFGEILLAGAPYLETSNVNPSGNSYGKECQPDCKASRNERCQRIDGLMKCVCRPGFARMFPDRPCKPTYTYSVKLALGSQGNGQLQFHESLSDNTSKQYQELASATHEGINRMVMQSDLRDVYHGVHITGFQPIQVKKDNGETYQGVMNEFYVQLSDNTRENRLKEVIEKYLRNNNYSLGGTDVHAASELTDQIEVSDFDECAHHQFHDCSEHAQCFNLQATYTCSCLEGYTDLSVSSVYPGRICSAEPVGCERCNYHGACYSRDDRRVLCECFPWYAGSTCHINLKVVLISLVVVGALLTVVLIVCAVVACSRRKPRPPPHSIVACIQSMPGLQQGAVSSKQRADRRALINERAESGDASSIQNASLPYMPAKRPSSNKKCIMSDPPAHDPPPPPPAVIIPRARLHQHHHGDSRDNIARKRSLEMSNEEKLISYLESGNSKPTDEMRRKHSMESSYSANKDRNKQGALVSAGFKVSTTVHAEEPKAERDDTSSVNKADLEAELARFDSLRKSYSQEELSEWTDAERRLGELTLSEARSVGGTLPASTGRAASSTRLTHQTSDVSEFDSL